jgi:CubicO group peptidase (beta-lactamase class C family)
MQDRDLKLSLEASLKRHVIAGASAAIFQDGGIRSASAGLANVTTGAKLTPHTIMHLGSITKVINATLLMQMVDRGLVQLNQSIAHYLPDLQLGDPEAVGRITVGMLLNHSSGIDGEGLPNFGHDEETIEKGIRRMSGFGQLFEPGTRSSYCNAGTVIAGYLAQRLLGRSWYDLVRQHIFEPLDLGNSVTLPEDALLHAVSVGHYLDSGQIRRTSFAFLPMSFAPAGVTVMMSPSDLVAFAAAHLRDGLGLNGTRVLSEKSARRMRTISVDNQDNFYTYRRSIGFGWMILPDGCLYHGGGGPGISSSLYADTSRNIAVAVLTNSMHGEKLIREIIKPLGFESTRVPATGRSQAPSHVEFQPDHYVGDYEDVCLRFRVCRSADGLVMSRQMKYSPYEITSEEESAYGALTPRGNGLFLLSDENDELLADPDHRTYSFLDPDTEGRMTFIGWGMRLYRRVAV